MCWILKFEFSAFGTLKDAADELTRQKMKRFARKARARSTHSHTEKTNHLKLLAVRLKMFRIHRVAFFISMQRIRNGIVFE